MAKALNSQSFEADPKQAGFGVYIHWPFCLSKCPYCDFNSHALEAIDQKGWAKALLAELSHSAAETSGRCVTSIFFGGGTPSLMSPNTVEKLIETVGQHWVLADDVEITLEANPTTVEATTFQDFAQAGVNRLSIGVQSFDAKELAFLGRGHSADDAIIAIEAAAKTVTRYSFDMIYALPGQTVESWTQALEQAVTLAGGHLSIYQLTIEPGTAFHKAGQPAADPDLAADLYDASQSILDRHGLNSYEVSNHATPGEACRHNLTYWRGGDYVGVGPGAHGRLTLDGKPVAMHQIHDPSRWLETVGQQGHGTAKRRPLQWNDRAEEMILMGLRLKEGIDKGRFQSQTGSAIEIYLDTDRIKDMVGAGFMEDTETALKATQEGRLRLNSLLGRILKD